MKKGVALEYAGDIPRILAIARGLLFEKLIEIARQNNIPVYEDADIAEVLSSLAVGSEIPVELYRAIAVVFAYCYRVNKNFKQRVDQEF